MLDQTASAPVVSLTAEDIKMYAGLLGLAITSGIGLLTQGRKLLKAIRLVAEAVCEEYYKFKKKRHELRSDDRLRSQRSP